MNLIHRHQPIYRRIAALFTVLSCAIACTFPAIRAQAQGFPTKPIRLVVPYGPGGATDILGRMIAQKLSEQLGQTVYIDNKAGASGSIGTDAVAKAPPDGYTLVMASIGSHAINSVLYPKLPYDVNKDFAPIGLALTNHFVLAVGPTVPAKTIAELVTFSKGKKLFIGTAGYQQQLFGALAAMRSGIEMSNISYKGTAPALIDLAAGNVQIGFTDIAGAVPYVQSGKITPLAVSGTKRFPLWPNVPTVAEATGVAELEASGWMGIVAPAHTPPAIVNILNAALNKVLASPELKEKFAPFGAEPKSSTPAEFATLVRDEVVLWGKVAKSAGVKADE